LETELSPVVDGLQVYGRMTFNPSPPTIDIYPDAEFMERIAGSNTVQVAFTIRARAATADDEAGQEVLLEMMDPYGSASVMGAVNGDKTLGGTVDDVVIEPPSNFGAYVDPNASTGVLIGCTWRARVLL